MCRMMLRVVTAHLIHKEMTLLVTRLLRSSLTALLVSNRCSLSVAAAAAKRLFSL